MADRAAVPFLLLSLVAPVGGDAAETLSVRRTGGCGPPASVTARPVSARLSDLSGSRPQRGAHQGLITSTGMDRVRLGMTLQQVSAAYGARARRTTVRLEETPLPGIEVRDQEGRPLLTVMASDDRVDWILTRSPRLATARGARVGTRLRALQTAYGRGRVEEGELGVTVQFPRSAPGITFILDPEGIPSRGRQPLTWDRLRQYNPKVEAILVAPVPGQPNGRRQGRTDLRFGKG